MSNRDLYSMGLQHEYYEVNTFNLCKIKKKEINNLESELININKTISTLLNNEQNIENKEIIEELIEKIINNIKQLVNNLYKN